MSVEHAFGPNHAAVTRFLETLAHISWFSAVGSPPDETGVEFVDFHFLAGHFEAPYAPWQDALPAAESAIERLEFEHGRVGNHTAVQRAYSQCGFLPTPSVDALFQRVDTEFGDPATRYYRDLAMFPLELIDFPHRLVRGLALELSIADLDPSLTFFQALLPWFRRGRWPVGWSGAWPQGHILLW
jgi:hypothetical protein